MRRDFRCARRGLELPPQCLIRELLSDPVELCEIGDPTNCGFRFHVPSKKRPPSLRTGVGEYRIDLRV